MRKTRGYRTSQGFSRPPRSTTPAPLQELIVDLSRRAYTQQDGPLVSLLFLRALTHRGGRVYFAVP